MTFYIESTAPNDYTSVENVLIFSPGINESCTTVIPIIDDSVLENDEVFSVMISTTDSDVSLDPASANVTIVDNDGKTFFSKSTVIIIMDTSTTLGVTVGLQQPSYNVSEDGMEIIICAILSGQIEREVSVLVSTEDGLAIGKWDLIINAYE